MSDAQVDPDVAEQVQELHQKKDETVAKANEQHQALLEAAAEGEEAILEEFEETHIGQTNLVVSTQLKGKVARKLDKIYDAEDTPPGQMLDVYIDVLTSQTKEVSTEYNGESITVESDSEIRAFYRGWIDNHDIESAAELALERVVEEPNELEQNRREDALKSFPENEQGRRNRRAREFRS